MTKKQMIEGLTEILKTTGKSVVVKDFGCALACGYPAIKAYEIKYDPSLEKIYCYPWAWANVQWEMNTKRLGKRDIETIYNRALDL